jgi:hypothetical protein
VPHVTYFIGTVIPFFFLPTMKLTHRLGDFYRGTLLIELRQGHSIACTLPSRLYYALFECFVQGWRASCKKYLPHVNVAFRSVTRRAKLFMKKVENLSPNATLPHPGELIWDRSFYLEGSFFPTK